MQPSTFCSDDVKCPKSSLISTDFSTAMRLLFTFGSCYSLNNSYGHSHTHRHTQPFYSSLNFVRDNLGHLVPEGTFRHLLDFLVQNEDNTGRPTNNPDGLPPPPIQTNWCPHPCHSHHFYLDKGH